MRSIILLLPVSILLCAGCREKPRKPSAYVHLLAMSANINKMLPIRVDSILTLHSTAAVPVATLQYNYTLKIDTNLYDMPAFKEALRVMTVNEVRTSADGKGLRKLLVTIENHYRDTLGNYLFRIVVEPEDYLK